MTTTTTSRRALLAGIAAAPALAVPALAMMPASAVAPDPIFAAIERHRVAYAEWSKADDARQELEDSIPSAVEFMYGPPITCVPILESRADLLNEECWTTTMKFQACQSTKEVAGLIPAWMTPQERRDFLRVARRQLKESAKKIADARAAAGVTAVIEVYDKTWAAQDAAAIDLVSVMPTTLPGVIALLRYAVEPNEEGAWPEHVAAEDGDDPHLDGRDWGTWLWHHTANSLERIAAA